jgi:hypothetical protein
VTSNWQDPPKRERKRINAYGEVVTDRPVVSFAFKTQQQLL